MKEEISKLVIDTREETIKLLRELVSIKSETGEEGEIIKKLEQIMIEFGFDEIKIDSLGNLIGRIGTGEKILAIDGHVDTVAVGDLNKWTYDPLKGIEIEGKMFGRGSCDQKGGLASALIACKLLKKLGVPKNITVYLVASVYEELYEGLNWQYIIEKDNIKPDAVILTEPSNLKLILGHRGRMDIGIVVDGVSSHGADPDRGINAIYKMAPILLDIEELHKELPVDSTFGKGTITITDIKSKTVSMNAVAYNCSIHIDRRLGVNDTKESVIAELENLPAIKDAHANVATIITKAETYTNHSFTIERFYPSWIMDKNDPLIEKAEIAFRKQFNHEPEFGIWRFSTNGVATKGLYNIPTFGFGPGDEQYAHTYDEYILVEQLMKAIEFYLSFCYEFSIG